MNIAFTGKYKSIENFEWLNIPKLSVITGKNGTGKSQLLELIKAGVTKQWENVPQPPNQFPNITNENYRTEHIVYLKGEWALNNLGAIGLNHIQQEREQYFSQFTQRLGNYRGINEQQFKERKTQYARQHTHTFLNEFYDDFIERNQLYGGKSISKDEFLNSLPNNVLVNLSQQATNTNIGKVFYNYRLDLIEAKANGITEAEFISKNSEKPWVQINELFKNIQLPFELNNPEEINMRDMYTPILKNIEKNEPINFTDLSSGEKVLVSLVFWLFNSNDKGIFPKLLLLDEPDAHLHPSMTKQFFHVLKDVLCQKYDVRVIMTTHSPSTVAIAPEDSLFVMKKDGSRIEKAFKDSALGILTSGVPSFSINYENRRQVFVESPNDVTFYEKLYNKLAHLLIPEISLSFISSGESRTDKNGIKIANCGQVINICETLRNAGNKFIWGIIDWDTDNEPDKFPYIKVLGNKERYAIESYLFDPILLAAMLLREKQIEKLELGLNQNLTYTDFKKLSEPELQFI